MATSGSIDYNLNASAVCKYAMQKAGLLAWHDDMDADELSYCLRELNVMLKEWQMTGPNLWRYTEGSLTLTNATQSYTLATRVRRFISARYKDGTREIPMVEMTRQRYFELPIKSSSGVPTQFYFDRQRASSVLYVWPVIATVDSETIEYTYQRVIEDIDASTNDLDIPQEHFAVVGLNLAARLCDDTGQEGPAIDRLQMKAAELLALAKADDREDGFELVPESIYG